ncbi:MAG: hypothetical protein KF892_25000 [Rhizobacter sp.]|nr:hypothetical protein [Rhizobacter sp.]
MAYTPLEDSAIQQLARSVAAYDDQAKALATIKKYESTMSWQQSESGTLLIKTDANGTVHQLGPKTDRLVGVHRRYVDAQLAARQALAACSEEVRICQNLNRTTGANRVDPIVIRILNEFQASGLGGFCKVIGTYALYAYEAAAGVTFDPATTATNDVDVLLDVQQRMRLVRELGAAGGSMIQLLQRVDSTFERDEEQKESAKNEDGFAVDFLRRKEPGDSEPFSVSDNDGDIYPVQAENAQLFLNSPVFERIVIGVDGSMARMRTVDPRVFVKFKRWMSGLEKREFIKRGRDRNQADAVEQLLNDGLLQSALEP